MGRRPCRQIVHCKGHGRRIEAPCQTGRDREEGNRGTNYKPEVRWKEADGTRGLPASSAGSDKAGRQGGEAGDHARQAGPSAQLGSRGLQEAGDIAAKLLTQPLL